MNSCAICGRRGPHPICHLHAEDASVGWFDQGGGDIDAATRAGEAAPPEICIDPACPQWPTEATDRSV